MMSFELATYDVQRSRLLSSLRDREDLHHD